LEKLDEFDPIWGQPADVHRWGRNGRSVESKRSGNFRVEEGFIDFIRDWSPAERAKISTWILNRNLERFTPTIGAREILEIKNAAPLTISQKIDRFLLMLDKEQYRPGWRLPWHPTESYLDELVAPMHRLMLWIEAESDLEFYAFRDVLLQAGIIARVPSDGWCTLAYEGFRRLEQLRSVNPESAQAFVAMWFSDEMELAFVDGIKPAILDTGYEVQRIDFKEHSNKIDDEIISEIKRSRFLVADFTCGVVRSTDHNVTIVRGGVYYEAGFAQGLGIPVIWTVRKDQIADVHFDTRQYNHIIWSTADELREKLYNRIAAVVGTRRK
jgi:hypothetical protein